MPPSWATIQGKIFVDDPFPIPTGSTYTIHCGAGYRVEFSSTVATCTGSDKFLSAEDLSGAFGNGPVTPSCGEY